MIHLAKSIRPHDNKFIIESCREATFSEFTYLLFEFHHITPEKVRLRTKIFPSLGAMAVQINHSTV